MPPLASHDALHALIAIHASLMSPFLRQPYDPPLVLLRACDPALRQACLTHLVWLYSHWLPVLPADVTEDIVQDMTESAARRGMRALRAVVGRLQSEDHWEAVINPWQAHLLHSFQRLAPFPVGTRTQGEVCDATWGKDWPTTLGIRPNARHFPVYELARMSQELGISLREIRDELRRVQTQGNGSYLRTVHQICDEFRDIADRVLRMAGRPVVGQGRQRPPMVALRRWEDLPVLGTFDPQAEDFQPSGRPVVDERMYERKEKMLIRFGEDVQHDDDDELKEETPSPARSPVPARPVLAPSVLTPSAPSPLRPAPVPARSTVPVPVRPTRPPTPLPAVPTPKHAALKNFEPTILPDPFIYDVIDLSDLRTSFTRPPTSPSASPLPSH